MWNVRMTGVVCVVLVGCGGGGSSRSSAEDWLLVEVDGVREEIGEERAAFTNAETVDEGIEYTYVEKWMIPTLEDAAFGGDGPVDYTVLDYAEYVVVSEGKKVCRAGFSDLDETTATLARDADTSWAFDLRSAALGSYDCVRADSYLWCLSGSSTLKFESSTYDPDPEDLVVASCE